MTRFGRIALALPVALLVLAGCSTDGSSMAMVMCEQFVDQRVGTPVEHLSPMDGATVSGEGPFVVQSGFTEPQGGGLTRYTCTVEQADGDSWRLVDLTTDR